MNQRLRRGDVSLAAGLVMAALTAAPAAADPRGPDSDHAGYGAEATAASPEARRAKGCGFRQRDPDHYGVYDVLASEFAGSTLDAYDAMAADDFVCTRSVKHLRRVVVVGVYNDTPDTAESIDLRVLRNDRSGDVQEPSDSKVVCSFDQMPYEDRGWPDGNVVRLKKSPCRLKAGRTYWLEVQMNMNGVDPIAFWQWSTTTLGHGHAADWRNPLDGFQFGCTTYSGEATGGDRAVRSCLARDLPDDMMFSVR
jgi:hypothetical protein